MKVPLKTTFALLAGFLSVVLLRTLVVTPAERRIEGKPVSEWAELATARATSSEAQFMQCFAWSVLDRLSADESAAALLTAYRKHDLGIVEKTVRNLRLYRIERVPQLGWTGRFLELVYRSILEKACRRSDMVEALANAPEPSVAIPVLVAHADTDSADEAWTTLKKLGPAAGPALAAYVQLHPERESAATLLCLLQSFRTDCGQPNVFRLRDLFRHHPSPPIRALAADGIGLMGTQAEPAIADLRFAATNQFEWLVVRKSAAKALQTLMGTSSIRPPPP